MPCSAPAQSSINWLTAIQYAKLAKIAEGVSPKSDYTSVDKQLISEQGYTFLQPIYGSDLSTDATPDVSDTVSYGYLALSSAGELVAVLRGTDTVLEWIDDAQFYFVFNPIPHTYGFTEEGFSGIYKSLRVARSTSSQTVVSSIKGYVSAGTAKSVTITGHSLGGALATLLALDVARNTSQESPVVFTFASPRVGEEFFANDFNDTVPASYRIYNNTDVVPDLPLWPYTSVKTSFKLVSNSSQVNTDITCSHHLTTYLWLMGQKAGVNAGSLEANCIPGN